MKKGKHTEEQIIGVLKQVQVGRTVKEDARELGVSEVTIYTCSRVASRTFVESAPGDHKIERPRSVQSHVLPGTPYVRSRSFFNFLPLLTLKSTTLDLDHDSDITWQDALYGDT